MPTAPHSGPKKRHPLQQSAVGANHTSMCVSLSPKRCGVAFELVQFGICPERAWILSPEVLLCLSLSEPIGFARPVSVSVLSTAAVERRGDNFERSMDFNLETESRIWL